MVDKNYFSTYCLYKTYNLFFCQREIVNKRKGEESMKKFFAAVLMFFVVVAFAGASYAWQGRMSGMGKPLGLIEDESDFLIHPAQIASGEGIKYYLDYGFTYTGLIHMDSKIDVGIPGIFSLPILDNNLTSGHTTEHNTLVGASFPFAKGRMGVFFGYDKQNGDM